MANFVNKFKEFMFGGDVYDEEPISEEQWSEQNEDSYQASSYEQHAEYEPQNFVEEQPVPQAVTTPVYQQPVSTVVMLSPYDIRTSQIVADHIREQHIVICNLTSGANNQRVVDYISGAVYMADGRIEPTAVKTTFVCTPKNVNLIVDGETESSSATKVSAL